jgi:hypothetical protein
MLVFGKTTLHVVQEFLGLHDRDRPVHTPVYVNDGSPTRGKIGAVRLRPGARVHDFCYAADGMTVRLACALPLYLSLALPAMRRPAS